MAILENGNHPAGVSAERISMQTAKKYVAVIESTLEGYPLGLIHSNKVSDDVPVVLDGQQRITSFGRSVTNKFALFKNENGMEEYFSGIALISKSKILETKLLIYECEGVESEIKEWFKNNQYRGRTTQANRNLSNAVYSGPFVTLGKVGIQQ